MPFVNSFEEGIELPLLTDGDREAKCSILRLINFSSSAAVTGQLLVLIESRGIGGAGNSPALKQVTRRISPHPDPLSVA